MRIINNPPHSYKADLDRDGEIKLSVFYDANGNIVRVYDLGNEIDVSSEETHERSNANTRIFALGLEKIYHHPFFENLCYKKVEDKTILLDPEDSSEGSIARRDLSYLVVREEQKESTIKSFLKRLISSLR